MTASWIQCLLVGAILAAPVLLARPAPAQVAIGPEAPGADLSPVPSFVETFDRLDLYDPRGGTGRWKTSYAFGAQFGPWAWNSRSLENELQVYSDAGFAGTGEKPLHLDPFALRDGRLTIMARRVGPVTAALLAGHDWTSGLLTTEKSFAQTYGYFEIRARLPEGDGFWPAFWLLPLAPDGATELDVIEQIGGAEIFQTVHSPGRSPKTFITRLPEATRGFHDYAALWTPERITFYVDGRPTARHPTPDSMHKPMYLLVNLAVSRSGWAGRPDPASDAADLVVERIRVFALPDRRPEEARNLSGGPGDDRMAGTPWADGLAGGAGNDLYLIDDPGDRVVEAPGQGRDRIESIYPVTLPENVEDLTLTGSRDAEGVGNARDNRLVGNIGRNLLLGLAGDDVLDGGDNVDILVGGPGDDIYVLSSWYADHADRIVEQPEGGTDTVQSAIDHVLPPNVEILELTGTEHIAATGNALANRLRGNAGANRIEGRGGDDLLEGGGGNDLFVFAPGSGHDRILDFGPGDSLDLSGYAAKGIAYDIRPVEGGVLVRLGAEASVRLDGVAPGDLAPQADGIAFHAR